LSQALLRLFEDHHEALFRFAYRLTGSAAEAEDIVQECFLGLLKPNSAYDARRTPPRTYLFGAVRNQALKRIARRGRTAELQDDASDLADAGSPEAEAQRTELGAAVQRAIAELPPTQREVLLLAHYEQMSLAEIAEALSLEIGAVKSRLQRARAGLKEALAPYARSVEKNVEKRP